MAVLDYVKLYKDKGKESWGKLQGRQKVIFSGIGIGIVVLFFVLAFSIGGGSGGMVPLRVSVKDPDAAIQRLTIFGIKAQFSDKDNAVIVEEAKEMRAARILASAKMLPDGEKAYGFVKESNLAQTDSARQLAYRVELQALLSDTIAAMDNVESAIVNITPPSRPYYYRFDKEDLRAKASVMVQTDDSKPLMQAQIMAIAQLIAGSMETMQAENVLISDTSGKHYPIDPKWRQAYSMMEVARNAKLDVERNVMEVLRAFNPLVAANIEVRTGMITESEHYVDTTSKGALVHEENREESELSKNTHGSSGTEMNSGRDAINDPARVDVDSSKTLEEGVARRVFPTKDTTKKDDTVKPDYANSSISVSISEEFKIDDTRRKELTVAVSKATNIPLDRVSIISTPALQPEIQGAGIGGPWGDLLQPQNIVKIVLLLLAVAAFIALAVMMKKSAPKPLTLVDDEFVEEDDVPLPEIPTLPPVDQLSGNLVREKVVDLVRKNPKAAANLIKRWVILGK